jgi:hypothetical protein
MYRCKQDLFAYGQHRGVFKICPREGYLFYRQQDNIKLFFVPIHQLVAAKMAVSPDNNLSMFPNSAQTVYQPQQDFVNIGRFIPAPGTEHREYHFAAKSLKNKQWHITVFAVIVVEECAFLIAVGVKIAVIKV